MVVAVHETLTEVDRVAAATLEVYTRRRDQATEMPLAELIDVPKALGSLRAVVARGERSVEIVLDADVDSSSLPAGIWNLADDGWQPVVLIALDRIGEAHSGLRGAPCKLQPWWTVDDEVVFGAFEIP
ncbi:MAG: hypothetical protein IIC70_13225 [Acidobacteria bacterium]|jgi:hypothetical protein|nr:hypothetical protein [Acidobacteriota bacterium]MCH8130842.1 hypothetical protein [Acidobacteriota bacterium]MCH8991179.1 hypothetical protein [Acidobacteriota bacterium]